MMENDSKAGQRRGAAGEVPPFQAVLLMTACICAYIVYASLYLSDARRFLADTFSKYLPVLTIGEGQLELRSMAAYGVAGTVGRIPSDSRFKPFYFKLDDHIIALGRRVKKYS